MIVSSEVLEQIARLLAVDEAFTYSTSRDSMGSGVRLGDQVARRDVPLLDVYLVGKVFTELALKVRNQFAIDRDMRWLQDQSRAAYSAFGLTREQLGLPTEPEPVETKFIDRITAVMQEMEIK